MSADVYDKYALGLAQARSGQMQSQNEFSGRDSNLLNRMRRQIQEKPSKNKIRELSADEQIQQAGKLSLLQRNTQSQTISKSDSAKLEKAQEIIDFYNATYWKLLNVSKWIFDALDLIEGFGLIISLPLNIYLIFRMLKLKRLTKTGFNPYEYFYIIVEFIPIGDLYPGMAQLIQSFEKQAKEAKEVADKDLVDLQTKYPHLSLK